MSNLMTDEKATMKKAISEKHLKHLKDLKYVEFSEKYFPNISPEERERFAEQLWSQYIGSRCAVINHACDAEHGIIQMIRNAIDISTAAMNIYANTGVESAIEFLVTHMNDLDNLKKIIECYDAMVKERM